MPPENEQGHEFNKFYFVALRWGSDRLVRQPDG